MPQHGRRLHAPQPTPTETTAAAVATQPTATATSAPSAAAEAQATATPEPTSTPTPEPTAAPEPEEVGCDPSEKSDKPLGVATELTGLTVYAGTGDPGFGGDCGPAHAAQVFRPSGIGVDSHGNPYISTDHRIRKVDGQTGTISTIAGTGKPVYAGDNGFAINAQLKSPLAVGVDGAGNIYFVDSGNGRIRRFDTPVLSPVQGPTTNGALVPAHPDPSRRITVSSVEGSS